jgi:hypothetical protein
LFYYNVFASVEDMPNILCIRGACYLRGSGGRRGGRRAKEGWVGEGRKEGGWQDEEEGKGKKKKKKGGGWEKEEEWRVRKRRREEKEGKGWKRGGRRRKEVGECDGEQVRTKEQR